MKLSILVSDFLQTPISYIFPKIWSNISRRIRFKKDFQKDSKETTFLNEKNIFWRPIVDFSILADSSFNLSSNGNIIDLHKDHYFDVLGSGWLCWNLKLKSADNLYDKNGEWLSDIVNEENLNYSKRIWFEIQKIDENYIPIDWQCDIKSGYHFSSKTHFSKIKKIPGIHGVDVKIPWEIGRMQHLPVMISVLLNSHDQNQFVLKEVKCQILDFIMCNPPRWGIQWTSAMDVSIRLLNLSIVIDFLFYNDPNLRKSEFGNIVLNALKSHADFAFKYREQNASLSNNHYLANLTGLLFGYYSTHGNENSFETLQFLINENLKEIDKQFLNDGGNFESSLPYHCFSSEMAVLSMTLINRILNDDQFKKLINNDLLKQTVENKLNKAFDLIKWVDIGNGIIPQIGDNDSGRMFYWSYPYSILPKNEALKLYQNLNERNFFKMDEYVDRDYLNYSSSKEMMRAYFDESDQPTIHTAFILAISGRNQSNQSTYKNELVVDKAIGTILKYKEESSFKIILDSKIKDDIKLESKAFPDFGIYIFKSSEFYLIVNGANRYVKQYWPHGHNDKLSFELWVGGKPVVQDPGSFCYTSYPEIRNKYRSVMAHSTINFNGIEQNSWPLALNGVFRMIQRSKVELLHFSSNRLVLELKFGKYIHQREFVIKEDELLIKDQANFPFNLNNHPDIPFSNGYGKMLYKS